MKSLFDLIAIRTSKLTTRLYSTSFSLGIELLDKKFRNPIYSLYGFVRFADEIVDTFLIYDNTTLLNRFINDTWHAIDNGISLNPILHSFQQTINKYRIDKEIVRTFLQSMEMDLRHKNYDKQGFDNYVLGSAEVVGLMCLKIFCEGNEETYNDLKPYAMKLGAAYQKINFLRDLKADYKGLGRSFTFVLIICISYVFRLIMFS